MQTQDMSSIAMALVFFFCFLDFASAKLEDEFFYVNTWNSEILQISPGAYFFQDPIY